jgi:outer membrane protein OmpA-like peptidoglycan-associated protein
LLEAIHFWAGTADVKPESESVVEQLQFACRMIHAVVAETEGMPPLHIRVEGHVHETRNIEKCWRLSKESAAVIADKIADAGYPRSGLHPRGLGPSRPLGILGNPQMDRRVEVHVMDQGPAN